jgi:hypothetical protein
MSSHRRSMLSPHGEKHSGNATANPARAEEKSQLEDAGLLSWLDAAYHQSRSRESARSADVAVVLEAQPNRR